MGDKSQPPAQAGQTSKAEGVAGEVGALHSSPVTLGEMDTQTRAQLREAGVGRVFACPSLPESPGYYEELRPLRRRPPPCWSGQLVRVVGTYLPSPEPSQFILTSLTDVLSTRTPPER